jgi:heptaprenyl diphosphate synthase
MQEIEGAYGLDLDETRLLRIIQQKSGALFELPCSLGALVSGAPEAQRTALASYGRALGMSFQLVDDVRDIAAGELVLGKQPGTDLCEGVYTLPVLYTLDSRKEDGQKLRAILARGEPDSEQLRDALTLLRSNDCLSRTLEIARYFVQRAIDAALCLPEGSARESLLLLADLVTHRATDI